MGIQQSAPLPAAAAATLLLPAPPITLELKASSSLCFLAPIQSALRRYTKTYPSISVHLASNPSPSGVSQPAPPNPRISASDLEQGAPPAMLCSGRMLACNGPGLGSGRLRPLRAYADRLRPPAPARRWRLAAASAAAPGGSPDLPSSAPSFGAGDDQAASSSGFCIIEGPETVQDFAKLDLQEIQDNIRSRRNKIFLHMEEIRRLRIQQRIKNAELGISIEEAERELPDFPSFIPFLPPLSADNLKVYYATCFTIIAGIMVFGGFLAPILELKLGLGGTSYADFIRSVHLPMQLSQVDPIVASFSGGAVGVISALMVVEINNVKQQEHKRCKYCLGTGYLACARCSSTGALVLTEPVSTFSDGDQPLSAPKTERCPNCSGAGKVMCPTCLCTGMAMASEHDPRIDPFD